MRLDQEQEGKVRSNDPDAPRTSRPICKFGRVRVPLERTLHPDLAKRSPDDASAPGELEKLTAREMIEATAKGVGKMRDVPDRGIEVEVEHVHREIANVTVRSAVYVEYLYLVHTREGWKIINALWQHP